MQFGRSEKAKWALLYSYLGLIAREIVRKQKKGNINVLPLLMQRYNILSPFANVMGEMLTKRGG